MKYEHLLNINLVQRPYNYQFEKHAVHQEFDIVLIDGRDRVACLKSVMLSQYSKNSILVLDNTERVDGKYRDYLSLLQGYTTIHFEQPFVFGSIRTNPESKEGLILNYPMPTSGLAAGVYRDRSGNSNKGRSITTIAIPNALGQYTTQGIPLLLS
jgi:hypothetical protein